MADPKARISSGTLVAVLLTLSSGAGAAERATLPLQEGDWLQVDRKRFQALSTRLDGPQLVNAMPAVVSFSNAALFNTRQGRPAEYASVEQRNAYYNLISLVIEHDRNTPVPVKPVRFFHAATIVTLWTQVGAIDSVDNIFCINMSPATRSFLRSVNERLFDANLRVVHKLLFTWREPRDPRQGNPTAAIPAWQFDAQMVRMEQALVEDTIRELNPSAGVRREINNIDNCFLSYLGSLAARGSSAQWVAEAIGQVDFFNARHRRAIGYSMITMLHGRPKSDFTALLAAD